MTRQPFPPLPPRIDRLKDSLAYRRNAKKNCEAAIQKYSAQLDYEEHEEGEDVLPLRQAIAQMRYDLAHTEQEISLLKREIRRIQRSGM